MFFGAGSDSSKAERVFQRGTYREQTDKASHTDDHTQSSTFTSTHINTSTDSPVLVLLAG